MLEDIHGEKLAKEQAGTIVEQLVDNVYKVESANKIGKTIMSLALKTCDKMLLHFKIGK